jgi:uncharacterized protein YidB (DUF937 family)
MGLLDSLAGQVLGTQGQGGGNQSMTILLGLAGAFLSKPDSLQRLVSAFEGNGLGGIVGSWIGTGENHPVSSDQVHAVLGDKLQDLAQQSGASTQDLSSQLAHWLPQIVDKLTPDGKLPEGGVSLGDLVGVFKTLNR